MGLHVSPMHYNFTHNLLTKEQTMNTLDRIRKEQEAKRALQSIKDKAIVEAMFSTNNRPLNNAHLLAKEEN